MSNYHITTTITATPFRCVVCGYVDEALHTRRETDDPWAVMFTVDTVHQLIGTAGQIPWVLTLPQAANDAEYQS